MNPPSTLDAIAPFVEHGFALHWLSPRKKSPVNGDGWSTKPVATLDGLKSSYRNGYNVGVRPGKYSKVAGLYLHLIDLDVRSSEVADEARDVLLSLFPDADAWPRVISGSGGASRHFYFLTDKPFSSKKLAHSKEKMVDDKGKKHWLWEIELFGSEKQAVMPPSIHPNGKPYRWDRPFDFDLLEMGLGPILPSELMPSATRYDDPDADEDDEDYLLTLVRHRPLGLTIEEIRDAVMALPFADYCADRDGWLSIGMAIHHETGASPEGLEVWHEFSERSSNYDPEDQDRVWRSINANSRDPFTMASVMAILRENGIEIKRCTAELEGVEDYRKALSVIARFDLTNTETNSLLPKLIELASTDDVKAKIGDVRKDLTEARKRAKRDPEDDRKALESWLAEEFLRVYFKTDRLIRVNKAFWRYDRGAWGVCDDEYVANRVYRFIVKLMQKPGSSTKELLGAILESGRSDNLNALVNAVVGIVQKACAEDSYTDPLRLCDTSLGSVMNCANGELWFQPGRTKPDFRAHDPDTRLTVALGADYDPEADCPEWDEALLGIFANAEDPQAMVDHLHEIMGYCLQTSRNFASWFLFHGRGANGKSFVASVLQALLGPKAWTGRSLGEFSGSMRNAHVEAGLIGRLLLVDDDFKKGAHLPDDTIKKFSEMKLLTANPKYAGEVNFVCRATPLILTNHWPQTSDLSYGLDRRAVILPFTRTFEENERDMGLLGRVLRDERSGILNQCIAGWQRLRTRGQFSPPHECEVAKFEWLNTRNALSAFLRSCLEVTGSPKDTVAAEDIWTAFQRWGEIENVRKDWSRRRVLGEVGDLKGVEKYLSMGYTKYRGLKVKFQESRFESFDDFDELI